MTSIILLSVLFVVATRVLIKIARAKDTVKNANGFAEDSLLPDEKIVAKAEFHPLRDCLAPIAFLFFALSFLVLDKNRVVDTHLLYNEHFRLYGIKNESYFGKTIGRHVQLEWDSFTDEAIVYQGDDELTRTKMDIFTIEDEIEKRGLEKETEVFWVFSPIKYLLSLIINLLLFFGLYFLIRWINSKNEFVITSKRVIAKVGLIRRIAFELQTEQVESIEIHQGIVGRLFKYGTLMPCGIGASKVRVRFVLNPFEFRQHFYDLKKSQNN